MTDYKILMELNNSTYLQDIKDACEKHKCVVEVRETPTSTICEITTADPVNFFHLGRRWLSIDNVIKVI